MCDWDDFEDYEYKGDLEEDAFMDDFRESMEDIEEPDGGIPVDEFDEFNARDAFYGNAIFGNAYEEALEERKRRRLLEKNRARRDR
jgi:hypothetical protein